LATAALILALTALPVGAASAPGIAAALPHALSSVKPATTLPVALAPDDDEAVSPAAGHAQELRDTLLRTAERYSRMSYIPYVWGGHEVGAKSVCMACRACIGTKHGSPSGPRASSCQACQQCGLDCSHFVHRVFTDAGLSLAYLPTRVLVRSSRAQLRRRYGLIDIGRDLRRARPGDLLLQAHHVLLLLRLGRHGRGDIVHMSSSRRRGRAGGIKIVRDVDLRHFHGRLVKILRHVALATPPPPPPPPRQASPAPGARLLVRTGADPLELAP